jgi:hypothetical protein
MAVKIVHAEFIKCIPYILDNILFIFFKDIIAGIFPDNAYINKNVFTSKNKSFENFRIDIDDAKELYEKTKNAILKSNKINIEIKKDKMFKFLKIDTDLSWKNIKKKKIKDCLIDDFVEQNKKKYNLNSKQCKFLLFSIYISIIFKIIKHKDIYISDLKINKINGINFSDGKCIISEDIFDGLTVVSESQSLKYEKNKMESYWKSIICNNNIVNINSST